jgi:NAD(P)-dependent dehydrogenase (short-subunit alcohol dehydrogenase family)
VVASIEKDGGKAFAIQLDVSKSQGFSDFAQNFREALKKHWDCENFDFLINNAGTGLHAAFAETTEEQFDHLYNVHFKGVFFLSQKLLPILSDKGRIINISSGLARFASVGTSAYSAMKGAVEVLSRCMAKELGPRGITVNVIAPGAIETDFNGGMVRENLQINSYISSQTALGRVGLPEDIGPLVAMMCMEETRWVNAQRIEASGGMFI